MSLHPHFLRTERKPSTAPALILVGDTFCSLLLDQPGQSIKLGTLSFVSTPNTLRNMAEAEQSTSLQESACDWYIIKNPHTSHVAMAIPYFCNCCQYSDSRNCLLVTEESINLSVTMWYQLRCKGMWSHPCQPVCITCCYGNTIGIIEKESIFCW